VATAILLTASTAVLLSALIAKDFSIAYVANYTSRSTSSGYTITALWAGMEGSLLFWTLLSALYGASALIVQGRKRPDLAPIANVTLAAIVGFFISVLVFAADPFATTSPIPLDGSGLNPLLQSPFMAIHPVLLYLGFTGFAVPFAFAIASLVTGRLDVRWFVATRRATILAWGFLTGGIVLGSAWAYMELGWGGYWAWDPVENASLLPWLTGTAFLHSVMIQERRSMLKIWNVGLILATYSLSIFGTFLTRSGLLSSVHTFSESPVGQRFLPFLGVVVVSGFALLGWRLEKLRSHQHLDSMLSREAMFLFNNLLFVAFAFVVLWGTLYPVLVEWLRDTRISVGPPFYNSVVTPIGIALVGLAGIGPLVAWRRASFAKLRRHFAMPLAGGAAAILALAVSGVRSFAALLALGLCVFVAIATIGEFVRGTRAHRRRRGGSVLGALWTTVSRNKRRYGGYIVHLGVVLIVMGIAGGAFRTTWAGTVVPGDRFSVGDYQLTYESFDRYRTDEKMVVLMNLGMERNGRDLGTLTPQRNFHLAQRQPQSEVGIRTTLSEDFYVVLTQMDDSGRASLRAWINPLVIWIWIGGAVMILGTLVVLTAGSGIPPSRQKAAASKTVKEEAAV
jgi:cytochrome c-type biogenesis protein CcmF